MNNKFYDSLELLNKKLYDSEEARQLIQNVEYDTSKSILFTSKSGEGKTTRAIQIIKSWIENKPIISLQSDLIYVPEMKKLYLRYSTGEINIIKLLEKFKKIPILIIDDLGKEKSSEGFYEYLEEVFDSRYRNQLITIITTNLNSEEMLKKYGQSMFRRIVAIIGGKITYNNNNQMILDDNYKPNYAVPKYIDGIFKPDWDSDITYLTVKGRTKLLSDEEYLESIKKK